MIPTVAPQALQVDGVGHAARARELHCVARLVGPAENPNLLPAMLKHFGHDGQPVERPIAIQGAENFGLAPDLDQIAGP
jgi:hypothetical protein